MSRPYVPVSVHLFEDDRIMAVSRTAQLVYIGGLCVAKRLESDGRATLPQVHWEFSDLAELEDPGSPSSSTPSCECDDDHSFTVASWRKWNKST